jgi:hypothetical protein
MSATASSEPSASHLPACQGRPVPDNWIAIVRSACGKKPEKSLLRPDIPVEGVLLEYLKLGKISQFSFFAI